MVNWLHKVAIEAETVKQMQREDGMTKLTGLYKKIEKRRWWIAFCLGLVAVAVFCLAYPVLGSGSYVQITDQLDGEVINYIYNAKYLFSGQSRVPEFMAGADISSMTPPTLMGVLFYRLLPPFAAFACMHIFSVVVGYAGMFLLLRSLVKNPAVVFAVACLFIYLPFYPVYGLSVLGQPLLVWAFLQIGTGEAKLRHYLSIILYAVGSSLVLVGFAWLLIGAVVGVALLVRRRECLKKFLPGYLVLLGTYLLCNINLLRGFAGAGEAGASHREEMVITAIPDIWEHFVSLFLEGGLYVKAYNTPIAIAAVAVLVWKFISAWRKKEAPGAKCRLLLGMLCANALIAFVACLWRAEPIVDLRVQLGGVFEYFQFDRVYWLLPLGWYVILGLVLGILTEQQWEVSETAMEKKQEVGVLGTTCVVKSRGTIWRSVLGYSAALAVFLVQVFIVYPNSSIWHNLRLMIFPDTYHLMTWDDYYAEDVFVQIDDAIGRDKSQYRVASLGINPAAALYSGFHCIDGYSNLYPLEYKHEFRKIIEKELDKSSEVAVYFDTWGNRCYLLNSETGNYMMVQGGAGSYKNVELNVERLRKMGVEYLFSAMPMENAEDLGLALLREEPFATEDSYYEIWVYRVP